MKTWGDERTCLQHALSHSLAGLSQCALSHPFLPQPKVLTLYLMKIFDEKMSAALEMTSATTTAFS